MKRIKIIFINVLFVTATTLLLRTIGLMFQVYLSNKIGPEGMGLFQLILSVYYLSVTLAVAGIRLQSSAWWPKKLAGNRPGALSSRDSCPSLRGLAWAAASGEQFCY